MMSTAEDSSLEVTLQIGKENISLKVIVHSLAQALTHSAKDPNAVERLKELRHAVTEKLYPLCSLAAPFLENETKLKQDENYRQSVLAGIERCLLSFRKKRTCTPPVAEAEMPSIMQIFEKLLFLCQFDERKSKAGYTAGGEYSGYVASFGLTIYKSPEGAMQGSDKEAICNLEYSGEDVAEWETTISYEFSGVHETYRSFHGNFIREHGDDPKMCDGVTQFLQLINAVPELHFLKKLPSSLLLRIFLEKVIAFEVFDVDKLNVPDALGGGWEEDDERRDTKLLHGEVSSSLQKK